MSSGTTTRAGHPFPTGADPFTLRGDLQDLAESLDDYAPITSGTSSARPVSNSVIKDALYFAENTGTLSRADGVTAGQGGWSEVAPKDAAAAVASLRTLGSGAQQAAAGNDPRLSDARPPTNGSVRNVHVAGDAAIDPAKIALLVDQPAGTASLRTLGRGATQALAGNDAAVTDARSPTTHASRHQPGGSDAMAVDAAAATGSLRTLGPGATQAAPGNDSRMTNARTPTAHAASHQPGGSDAMAVDAAAGTGSLRTLGSGGSQAAPGNDSRFAADGAANVATRRTLGTGGQQAAPGNDGRFHESAETWKDIAERQAQIWPTYNGTILLRFESQGDPGAPAGQLNGAGLIHVVDDDYAIAGRPTVFRLRCILIRNGVPANRDFTFGLHQATSMGSAGGPFGPPFVDAIGGRISGSGLTFSNPGTNSASGATGSGEFSIGTPGLYVIGVALSGSIPANSYQIAIARLQVRQA